MNNSNDDNAILKNYSSPTAPTNIESEAKRIKLSMVNTNGRIGRLRFISWSTKVFFLGLVLATIVLTAKEGTSNSVGFSVHSVISFCAIWQMLIVMKRLQDFSVNKWFALLVFVPIANIILGLMCLFKVGDENINQYGPAEQPLAWHDKVMITLFFLSPIFGVIAGLIQVYQSIS